MKKVTKMVAWLFMAAFLFALAGCGLEVPGTDTLTEDSSNNSSDNNSVTTITSDINTATTWTSDKLYVIASDISVNAILTIQPGTIIKFKSSKGISVGSSGLIYANGTATGPIIFTSYKDDANGGDTNGDGSITSAAVGDWHQIALNASDSTFNYCEFYYGGGGSDKNTLDLNTYSATVKNSTFAHNDGGTLSSIWNNGVIGARGAAKTTVVAGNIFYDNNLPILINGSLNIDDSNVFHNPADVNQINKYNGIFVLGYGGGSDVDGQINWSETEVPFVMTDYIVIKTGATLTLGNNVIIKFVATASIDINGILVASATTGNKIVFTSVKDDGNGGDTNGDGNMTSPAVADWGNIEMVSSGGSTFNNCEFYYGGNSSSTNYKSTLDLRTYNTTITNCTFAHNDGGSLSTIHGVIDAGDAFGVTSSSTIITGNVFYDNNIPLKINVKFNLDDSNVFHNPANTSQKNTYNGIFVPGYGSSNDITGSITWSETEVPFILTDYLIIKNGASLTLGDNVVLKFNTPYELEIKGSLVNSSGSGVWFTSIKDDAHGGDTNGDASVTSPAVGDWDGINVYNGSSWSWAQWSSILYDSH